MKTYPNPSVKHDETVCTAAISESGKWLRIYPIPYRYLPREQQYKKWQWIELGLAVRGYQNDPRPESREPDVTSIRLLGEPLSVNQGWRHRREIVDHLPHHTLRELEQRWEENRTSLGIIRPRRVLDLEISRGEDKWSPKHEANLSQPLLFGKKKELQRIPYRFHYVFTCDDSVEPHRLIFEDWELGALFLRERKSKGEQEALKSVRNKFLGQICRPDNDVRFFVGSRHPVNQWLVIGLFYPPKLPPPSPSLFG
ncbi:MAG: hypothetical protein NTV86_13410 [Planctomycetota bacterium]|nr:hypothetical protein [Planctomycetota bacterium]